MPRLSEHINLSDGLKLIPIPELITYAASLATARNYSQRRIRDYNERLNDLRRSAAEFGVDMLTEDFIAQHIEEGRERSTKHNRGSVQRKALLNFIATAINTTLVFTNVKCSADILNSRFRESLSAYEQHIRGSDKSADTVKSYLQTATKFLLFLEHKEKFILSELTAIDIRDFIAELGTRWSPRSMQIVPSHLKDYLRFEAAPVEAILFSSFRTPRKSKPVRAMSPDDVEALWRYVEGGDGDLRSKAIVAVLLATGMRPIDIVKLELGDVNWSNDSISFVQSKTGESMSIRLFPSVGSAIARYATGQRARGTGLKPIFLTKTAPYRELAPSICNHILKEAFNKVGVAYAPDGLHCPRAARRSLVSRMIAKGIPVQKAAASIGHVDEKSIDLYTELDVERMRSICLPIPTPMKGWCV